MEGSEGEAIFNSLNLNPQLFINEVLNSVDDLVDEAFDFFRQEASTKLKIEGTERTEELSKGVAYVKNMVQSELDKRLSMWEKYCLRHCFSVPPGFSLPKANDPSHDMLLKTDAADDSELDAKLDSLRNKLSLVGKECADLNKQLQTLDMKSILSNQSATSINEALELYENESVDDLFQELISTSFEFRSKIENLKTSRADEMRTQIPNGDASKMMRRNGLFSAKLEELQQFWDDISSVN